MAGDAKSRHAVGARQHAGGKVGGACALRAYVGALIVEEHIVHRQQHTVRIRRDADAVSLLAGVGCRDEILAAVFDPFDRPTETQRP